MALAGFGKLNDLVCYRLFDIVGAVSDPEGNANLFERNAEDAYCFRVELFAI